MNIPLILGIGLSAQPVSGCDIGGFCAAWQVGLSKQLGETTPALHVMLELSLQTLFWLVTQSFLSSEALLGRKDCVTS